MRAKLGAHEQSAGPHRRYANRKRHQYFPTQIEAALLKVPGLAPQYLILVDRPKDQLDTLEIQVEATADLWLQGELGIGETQRRVNREMHETLGIQSTVVIVEEPHKVERSLGKAVRVVDRRATKMGN